MRTIRNLRLVAGLLLVGGTGCGDIVADRIDAICACEGCSDRRLDEVTIGAEAAYEIAEAYECTDLLDPYWECQVSKYQCEDGEYEDDDEECSSERREYVECLDAKSSRDSGSYRADENL
jgi:hypothetical protein